MVAVSLAHGKARITVESEYPQDGVVTVRVDESPEQPWTLSLRIPAWSRGATLEVAGQRHDATPDDKGYVRVQRTWALGDVVRLELPMPVRLTVAHPSVDAVRGSVAIERGPVTYCLESHDQVSGVDLDHVELVAGGALRVAAREDLLGGTLVVEADGLVRDDSGWSGHAGWVTLGEVPTAPGRRVTLTAVPYYLWANRGPSAMRVWVPLAT